MLYLGLSLVYWSLLWWGTIESVPGREWGADSGREVEREGRLNKINVLMSGTKVLFDYSRSFIVMKGLRPLLWYCRSDLRQVPKEEEDEEAR